MSDNNTNTTIENLPDILTAQDIARFLGIGYGKSLHTIKYGGIPYMKLGNTYRVSKQKLMTWIESSVALDVPFEIRLKRK